MWIKNRVYEIKLDAITWANPSPCLLIRISKNSGKILCKKGYFLELMDFLDDKLNYVGDNLKHNFIEPGDKLKLLCFFKGVEAYGKKDGSKISPEEFDIIVENFLDIFLNKKSWVRRIYNYLTIEGQE